MSEEYKIYPDPARQNLPAGYWLMAGSDDSYSVKFYMPKKPRWLVRKMMQWLLGFEWRDFK